MNFDHILVIGFGGPTQPEEIRPFIENVTRGIPIPEVRLKEVEHHYHLVGGASRYNEYTFCFLDKLKRKLTAASISQPVFIGMRNWDPYLKQTLAEIKAKGLKCGVGIILAPHRCDSSYEKYIRNVEEAKAASDAREIQYVYLNAWYDQPGFIDAQAQQVLKILDNFPVDKRAAVPILFSAHSIPLEMNARSSYAKEVEVSCKRIAERLSLPKWRLAWQSRSGSPRQPWLEPDVISTIADLKKQGEENVLVVPVGFLCDNVEVLYDLDIEARQEAEKMGIHYKRASTVADHDSFVEMFVELIQKKEFHMSGIQKAPYLKDEQPGKKAYCACGESANQPYCDGAHARKNTGKVPMIVEITEAKKVAWCGCRASKNLPFCDGSHKSL